MTVDDEGYYRRLGQTSTQSLMEDGLWSELEGR